MTAEIADGIASSAGIATSEKSIAEEGDLVVEFYNCSSEVYEALSSITRT